MADTSPPAPEKGSTFGFLAKKIGPAPVWVWGAIVVGAYYWYTKYGPGASKTAATASPSGKVTVVKVPGARGKTGPPGPAGPAGPPGHRPKPPPRRKTSNQHKPVAQPMTQPAAAAAPSPVYDAYIADASGVPEPVQAYAPMTAGAIYGG